MAHKRTLICDVLQSMRDNILMIEDSPSKSGKPIQKIKKDIEEAQEMADKMEARLFEYKYWCSENKNSLSKIYRGLLNLLSHKKKKD